MNPIARTNSTPATRMIRGDHAQVLQQFHKLDMQHADAVRDPLVRGICVALEVHAQLEEEIFYPQLREFGISSASLEHAAPEHQMMRRQIAKLRSLKGQRALEVDAFHELLNAVMHHVADEETQLLPAAERFLSHDRLCELGARMAARRKELMRLRATETALTTPAKAAWLTVGALLAGTMLLRGLRRTAPRALIEPKHRAARMAPPPWITGTKLPVM